MKVVWTLLSATLLTTAIDAAEIDRELLPTKEMVERERGGAVTLGTAAREKLKVQTLLAEEEKERVELGTRETSHIDFVAHQEARAEEKKKSEGELQARATYYTSHPGAYHTAVGVTIFGEQVTLEDGSVWSVSYADQWKTLDWLTTDNILLMQNRWFFSSYKFMLINQNTGREVECNLIKAPYYAGMSTHWIAAIDYYNNELILEDGSIWRIDPFDFSLMKKWMVNDTVIIGFNELGSVYHPNILINVSMINYCCGICLNNY